MKRRTLLAASAFALQASRASAAERLIGWISPESAEVTAPFFEAFSAGLLASLPPGREPVRVVERYGAMDPADVAERVAELQRLGVRLIVSQGAATVPVVAAKPSVPVVFGYSGDPVVAGFAQSLARPGGNATGVSFMSIELNLKRIDLLRVALPDCRKIALLSNVRHFGEENEIAACQSAVRPLGIELAVHRVRLGSELGSAVADAAQAGAQALVMLPSSLMVREARSVAAECLRRRIALISGWASIARSGALLTYGPNLQDAYKRVALYAVRVLDGASPATLPIEQPTIFELAVNAKTAAALGLSLPANLMAQADEVIE
jgi:putative ABC transport system substrate-binding protein